MNLKPKLRKIILNNIGLHISWSLCLMGLKVQWDHNSCYRKLDVLYVLGLHFKMVLFRKEKRIHI